MHLAQRGVSALANIPASSEPQFGGFVTPDQEHVSCDHGNDASDPIYYGMTAKCSVWWLCEEPAACGLVEVALMNPNGQNFTRDPAFAPSLVDWTPTASIPVNNDVLYPGYLIQKWTFRVGQIAKLNYSYGVTRDLVFLWKDTRSGYNQDWRRVLLAGTLVRKPLDFSQLGIFPELDMLKCSGTDASDLVDLNDLNSYSGWKQKNSGPYNCYLAPGSTGLLEMDSTVTTALWRVKYRPKNSNANYTYWQGNKPDYSGTLNFNVTNLRDYEVVVETTSSNRAATFSYTVFINSIAYPAVSFPSLVSGQTMITDLIQYPFTVSSDADVFRIWEAPDIDIPSGWKLVNSPNATMLWRHSPAQAGAPKSYNLTLPSSNGFSATKIVIDFLATLEKRYSVPVKVKGIEDRICGPSSRVARGRKMSITVPAKAGSAPLEPADVVVVISNAAVVSSSTASYSTTSSPSVAAVFSYTATQPASDFVNVTMTVASPVDPNTPRLILKDCGFQIIDAIVSCTNTRVRANFQQSVTTCTISKATHPNAPDLFPSDFGTGSISPVLGTFSALNSTGEQVWQTLFRGTSGGITSITPTWSAAIAGPVAADQYMLSPVFTVDVISVSVVCNGRVALRHICDCTIASQSSNSPVAIFPSDFAANVTVANNASNTASNIVSFGVNQTTLYSAATPLAFAEWSQLFGGGAIPISPAAGFVVNLQWANASQYASDDALKRYYEVTLLYDPDETGAHPPFAADDLEIASTPAVTITNFAAPAGPSPLYAVTIEVPTTSPITFDFRWRSARGPGEPIVYRYTPPVIILSLVCPDVTQLGTTVRCILNATEGSAPYTMDDVGAPYVLGPEAGDFSAYEFVGPGPAFAFNFTNTNRTGSATIRVDFARAMLRTITNNTVLAAKATVNYLNGTLACPAPRVNAAGGSVRCFINKTAESGPFPRASIFAVASGNESLASVGPVSLAPDGTWAWFDVHGANRSVGGSVLVSAGIVDSISGVTNPVTLSPASIAVLRVSVNCTQRVFLSQNATCSVKATDDSPPLLLSDFSSASVGAAAATLAFLPSDSSVMFTASPSALGYASASANFASGGDPASSSVTVIKVHSIVCSQRIQASCSTPCVITKESQSPDLLPSDVVVLPNLGATTAVSQGPNGTLLFDYTGATGGGNTGASIRADYSQSVAGAGLLAANTSIVVVSATFKCELLPSQLQPFRILKGHTYTCYAVKDSGSANLTVSDLAITGPFTSFTVSPVNKTLPAPDGAELRIDFVASDGIRNGTYFGSLCSCPQAMPGLPATVDILDLRLTCPKALPPTVSQNCTLRSHAGVGDPPPIDPSYFGITYDRVNINQTYVKSYACSNYTGRCDTRDALRSVLACNRTLSSVMVQAENCTNEVVVENYAVPITNADPYTLTIPVTTSSWPPLPYYEDPEDSDFPPGIAATVQAKLLSPSGITVNFTFSSRISLFSIQGIECDRSVTVISYIVFCRLYGGPHTSMFVDDPDMFTISYVSTYGVGAFGVFSWDSFPSSTQRNFAGVGTARTWDIGVRLQGIGLGEADVQVKYTDGGGIAAQVPLQVVDAELKCEHPRHVVGDTQECWIKAKANSSRLFTSFFKLDEAVELGFPVEGSARGWYRTSTWTNRDWKCTEWDGDCRYEDLSDPGRLTGDFSFCRNLRLEQQYDGGQVAAGGARIPQFTFPAGGGFQSVRVPIIFGQPWRYAETELRIWWQNHRGSPSRFAPLPELRRGDFEEVHAGKGPGQIYPLDGSYGSIDYEQSGYKKTGSISYSVQVLELYDPPVWCAPQKDRTWLNANYNTTCVIKPKNWIRGQLREPRIDNVRTPCGQDTYFDLKEGLADLQITDFDWRYGPTVPEGIVIDLSNGSVSPRMQKLPLTGYPSSGNVDEVSFIIRPWKLSPVPSRQTPGAKDGWLVSIKWNPFTLSNKTVPDLYFRIVDSKPVDLATCPPLRRAVIAGKAETCKNDPTDDPSDFLIWSGSDGNYQDFVGTIAPPTDLRYSPGGRSNISAPWALHPTKGNIFNYDLRMGFRDITGTKIVKELWNGTIKSQLDYTHYCDFPFYYELQKAPAYRIYRMRPGLEMNCNLTRFAASPRLALSNFIMEPPPQGAMTALAPKTGISPAASIGSDGTIFCQDGCYETYTWNFTAPVSPTSGREWAGIAVTYDDPDASLTISTHVRFEGYPYAFPTYLPSKFQISWLIVDTSPDVTYCTPRVVPLNKNGDMYGRCVLQMTANSDGVLVVDVTDEDLKDRIHDVVSTFNTGDLAMNWLSGDIMNGSQTAQFLVKKVSRPLHNITLSYLSIPKADPHIADLPVEVVDADLNIPPPFENKKYLFSEFGYWDFDNARDVGYPDIVGEYKYQSDKQDFQGVAWPGGSQRFLSPWYVSIPVNTTLTVGICNPSGSATLYPATYFDLSYGPQPGSVNVTMSTDPIPAGTCGQLNLTGLVPSPKSLPRPPIPDVWDLVHTDRGTQFGYEVIKIGWSHEKSGGLFYDDRIYEELGLDKPKPIKWDQRDFQDTSSAWREETPTAIIRGFKYHVLAASSALTITPSSGRVCPTCNIQARVYPDTGAGLDGGFINPADVQVLAPFKTKADGSEVLSDGSVSFRLEFLTSPMLNTSVRVTFTYTLGGAIINPAPGSRRRGMLQSDPAALSVLQFGNFTCPSMHRVNSVLRCRVAAGAVVNSSITWGPGPLSGDIEANNVAVNSNYKQLNGTKMNATGRYDDALQAIILPIYANPGDSSMNLDNAIILFWAPYLAADNQRQVVDEKPDVTYLVLAAPTCGGRTRLAAGSTHVCTISATPASSPIFDLLSTDVEATPVHGLSFSQPWKSASVAGAAAFNVTVAGQLELPAPALNLTMQWTPDLAGSSYPDLKSPRRELTLISSIITFCPEIIFKYGTIVCSIIPGINSSSPLLATDFAAGSSSIASNATLTSFPVVSWAAGAGLNFSLTGFVNAQDAPFILQTRYSELVGGAADLRNEPAVFGPAIDLVIECDEVGLTLHQTTNCNVTQTVGMPLLDSSYFRPPRVLDGVTLNCTNYTDIAPGHFTFSCTSLVLESAGPASIVVTYAGPGGGSLPYKNVTITTETFLSCTPSRVAVGDTTTCVLSSVVHLQARLATTGTSNTPGAVVFDPWQERPDGTLVATARANVASRNESVRAILLGGARSPISFVEMVQVLNITCSPGPRVVLTTGALCKVNPSANSPPLRDSDLVADRKDCRPVVPPVNCTANATAANATDATAANSTTMANTTDVCSTNTTVNATDSYAGSAFSPMQEEADGSLSFMFFARSLVGNDVAGGCRIGISYSEAISPSKVFAKAETFRVIDLHELTCPASPMRRGRSGVVTCTLKPNSTEPSSPLHNGDLALNISSSAGASGVTATRNAFTFTFSHAALLASSYTFHQVWTPSVVYEPLYGTMNTSVVYNVSIVEASLSCTNQGRRLPGIAMACTLIPSAYSVSVLSSDFSISLLDVFNGATSSPAASGMNLTFTYTPPPTTTSFAGNSITVKYSSTIDVAQTVLGTASISYVQGQLTCLRTRLRVGAQTDCSVVPLDNWTPLNVGELGEFQVSGSNLLNTFGSTTIVTSNGILLNVPLTVSAVNMGTGAVLRVYYSSALNTSRHEITNFANFTVIKLAANALTCNQTRIAVGGTSRCTVLKDPSSPALIPGDLTDLYGTSASSVSPVVIPTGIQYDFKPTIANGPSFNYSIYYSNAVGGPGGLLNVANFGGSTSIVVIKADLNCVGPRRAPNATIFCRITPGLNSAFLERSDIGALATTSAEVVLGSIYMDTANKTIFLFEAQTINPTTTAAITLHYSAAMGGAPLGAFSLVIAGASLQCGLRVRAGATLPVSILRQTTSPNLQATDVFTAVYRIGVVQFQQRTFTQSGANLVTSLPIRPAPLPDEKGYVSVNYAGWNLGHYYPISTLIGNFSALWASLSCPEPRRRLNSVVSCYIIRANPSSPLIPEDIASPALQTVLANPTVPVPYGNGSLAINVTASILGSNHTVAASWVTSVGGGPVPPVNNVTVVDGRASCSPTRVAIGATITCSVLPAAGSPPLILSDVATGAVEGGYLVPGSISATDANITFPATAAKPKAAIPISVSWSVGLGGGEMTAQLVDVIEANLTCMPRAREGLVVPCSLSPNRESPALLPSDFELPTADPDLFGIFQAYYFGGSGRVNVTYTPTLLKPTVDVHIRYNSSVQPAQPAALWSPAKVEFVGAYLALNVTRVAVNCLVGFIIVPKENSSALLLSDFTSPSLVPALGVPLDLQGSLAGGSVAFAARPTVPGVALAYANYSALIGSGPVDLSPELTVLGASLNCSRRRVSVGTHFICYVWLVGDSPKIEASELLVSVEPASVAFASALANVTDSSLGYLYYFNVTTTDVSVNANVSVRYAESIDPDTRHIVDSPSPFVVIGGSLTCSHLRRRVGASVPCNVTKQEGSPDLLPSDIDVVANHAGVYGTLNQTIDGGIHFNFLTANVTTDAGARIEILWSALVNPTQSSVGNKTVVVVDAVFNCTRRRVAVGVLLNCTASPVPGSASLLESDFAAPSTEPAGALSSTAMGWVRREMGDGRTEVVHEFLASVASGNVSVALPWAEVLGGGAGKVPLDIIQARLVCSPRRRALNATTTCAVMPVAGSPPLLPEDFLPMTAEPSGYGNFTGMVALPSGILTFTYTTAVPLRNLTVLRVRYSEAVDSNTSDIVASGYEIETLAGHLSCTPSRRALGAAFLCTVAPLNETWPELLPADLSPATVDPTATTNISAYRVSAAVAGGIDFDVRATVQSLHPNVSSTWGPQAHNLPSILVSPPVTLTVLSARLNCSTRRVTNGSVITCWIWQMPLSPPLDASELVVAVEPAAAGVASPLANASDASLGYLFTFNVTTSSLSSGANISVRYAESIDPDTRHIVDSPSPFVTIDGGIHFDFLTANVTTDAGARIEILWSALVNPTQSSVGNKTVVVVDAVFNCTRRRVAVGVLLNCTASPVPGSASLLESDFAAPSTEPAGALSSTAMGWVRREMGDGRTEVVHEFLASVASGNVSVVLPWAEALGGGAGKVPLDIIQARLVCSPRRRPLNATTTCAVMPVAGSPPLLPEDFLPMTAEPSGYGNFTGMVALPSGNLTFTYTTAVPLRNLTVLRVRYSEAVDSNTSDIVASGYEIETLAGHLSCTPSRRALGAAFLCTVAPLNETWPELLPADLSPATVDPTATTNISAYRVSAAVAGGIDFDVRATVQSLHPNVSSTWGPQAHNLPSILVSPPVTLTVLSARLNCSTRRVTNGSVITCWIWQMPLSPPLDASELVVAVEPAAAGVASPLANASDASLGYLFTFNVTTSSLSSGANISVRYAESIDPDTRHIVDSPSPFVVIGGSLTCSHLRRRVGASVPCNVTKQEGSPDLLPSDIDVVANHAGVYGTLNQTIDGGIHFDFLTANVTTDAGARIEILWSALVNPTQSSVGNKTVVVVDAVFNCTRRRVAVGVLLNCTASPVPGSASLLESDFAAPSTEPAGALSSTAMGWVRREMGDGRTEVVHEFLASVASGNVSVVLPWAEALGGGAGKVPLDIIQARLVCSPRRRPLNATTTCAVMPVAGSPPLLPEDFLPMTAEPSGYGNFTGMVALPSGNLTFTYTTAVPLRNLTVLRVRYSEAVDSNTSDIVASGYEIETLAGHLSCTPSRRALGAAFLCTVAPLNETWPELLPADLSPATVDPTATTNISAYRVSAAVAGSIDFDVRATVQSLHPNVSSTWGPQAHNLPSILVSPPVTLTVLSARLNCSTRRVTNGSVITCWIWQMPLSPPLDASELVVAVEPAAAGVASPLANASDASLGYLFTFNVTTSSLSSGANISVRYAESIDPDTRHIVDSPSPFVVIGGSLVCKNTRFRRHVGARARCNVTKHVGSADLLPSDFVTVPCSAGVYESMSTTPAGDVTFTFLATNLTGDAGATIEVLYTAVVDLAAGGASVGNATIVVIDANFSCNKRRVAMGASVNCTATPVNGSGLITALDFSTPGLWPDGFLIPNTIVSWYNITGENGSYSFGYLFRASVPATEAVVRFRWAEEVGGGEVNVTLDVIGARLVCTTPRRAVNVSVRCRLARVGQSPPLLVSDFGTPFALPAGFGTFRNLTAEATGNLSLTYLPTRRLSAMTNLSVRYSFEVHESEPLVDGSGYGFATLAVTLACPARRALRVPVNCFVSIIPGESALLRPGDLSTASFAPDTAMGTALQSGIVYSADGTHANFSRSVATVVKEVNATAMWSAAVADAVLPAADPVSVAVVDASINCDTNQVQVEQTIACYIKPTAPSTVMPGDIVGPGLQNTTSSLRRSLFQLQVDGFYAAAGAVAPRPAQGDLTFPLKGQRVTEFMRTFLVARYSPDVDPGQGHLTASPYRYTVTGDMRITSARFLSNGYQIVFYFSLPTVQRSGSFPATDVLSGPTAALLGTGATCMWTEANALTCDTTADASIEPTWELEFTPRVDSADGSGRYFIGPAVVGPPLQPLIPDLTIDYQSEVAYCRRMTVRVTSVTGTGRRPAKIVWECRDNATCDRAPAAIQAAIVAAGSGRTFAVQAAVPLLHTYAFQARAINFLGFSSAPAVASIYKSNALPPALSIDGGPTVYTKTTALTTIKIIAQRVACETDDPLFYQISQEQFLWVRSEGITCSWELPERLKPFVPASVALDRPTILFPKNTLPPGEEFLLVMTGVDTYQDPWTSAKISIKVIVAAQPVVAVITGGSRSIAWRISSTFSGASSVDPDYTAGGSAIGTSSTLSYSWAFYNRSDGRAVHSTPPSGSPLLTVVPRDVGLVEGGEYRLELHVVAARAGVLPHLAASNATAAIDVLVAPGDPPAVEIDYTFPEQLLFVPRYPIVARCLARQPSNPDFEGEVVFEWSAPGGERELANLTGMAVRTSAATSTLVLNGTDGATLTLDRIYRLKCSAYASSSGPASAGSQEVSVRLLSGPRPGACGIFPTSGIALDTQFIVSCSDWAASYSGSGVGLRYQLKMINPAGGQIVTLTQPNSANVMRSLLPVGANPFGTVSVFVTITDEYNATTDYPLAANVTFPALDAILNSNAQAGSDALVGAGRSSVYDMLKQASNSIAVTNGDGDREASLANAAIVGGVVTKILNAVLGDPAQRPSEGAPKLEDARFEALLSPLLKTLEDISNDNRTTKQEIVQTISTITALSNVLVRTSSVDVQASLIRFLDRLIDGLDPCRDFEEVSKLVLAAGDAYVSSTDWQGLRDGRSVVYTVVDSALKKFASRAAACSVCGTKAVKQTGVRLAVTFGRVCFSETDERGIETGASSGGVLPSNVRIPRSAILLAQQTLGNATDSAPFTFYAYLRSPFPTGNENSTAPNAERVNVTSQVIDVEMPGVRVANLSTPILFQIPFPPGVEPALPLNLVFFTVNASSSLWASCSNVSLFRTNGTQYAEGYCNHMTPFAAGTAIPVPPAAKAVGGLAPYQALPESGGGSGVKAEVVAPAVAAGVFAASICCCCCFVFALRRRRRRKQREKAQAAIAHSRLHSNDHAIEIAVEPSSNWQQQPYNNFVYRL
eukprot:tig00021489_g21700.t1